MHKVYYQPEGIWVGDIMPYGEDGTFYLYHQRDTRNPEPFGEPFGWALATTNDFVNYKDFGESLERGGDEEVDQYIYAGTVFKVGDKYHALYTGCNRDKVRRTFDEAGSSSRNERRRRQVGEEHRRDAASAPGGLR